MRGLVVPGPLGQLLADYLVLLGRSIPDLTDAERARLPDAIAAMIGSCIAPTPAGTQAPQQFELTRMERVRRLVRQRIGSPSLGPNTLCRELGLSRTELYRMMEGEGGVAHYIQRQRLLACHAALRNPADTRPIAAIAEANGFFDASSFSRSFRRNFGATPGEVRAAAQTGGAPPPVLPATLRAEQLSLRDCLHAF
jgi:AraC-like DNA-binding protein